MDGTAASVIREQETGAGSGDDSVRRAVAGEVRRRHEALTSAVTGLRPVIALLRSRQRSGADVGLRLPQPGTGETRIEGWLRCAALHGSEPEGIHEYALSVQEDGRLQVRYPHPSRPAAGHDGWLAYHDTADGLAAAIEAAETREETRRIVPGVPFRL